MIDYRNLLMRYIAHVTDLEGTSFLHNRNEGDDFSDREWEELTTLRDDAYGLLDRLDELRAHQAAMGARQPDLCAAPPPESKA